MIDLDAVVAGAQDLAPLPESASRLATLLSQEDWELEQVVEVVRLDPALTGRVLGMANSAAFSGRGGSPDLDQAMMRLGPGWVLSMALSGAVRSELIQSLPVYGLTEGELWRHSVASALAMEQARAVCRLRVPPEAFAAALLHDIGKLVLGRFLRADDAEYVTRAREEGGQSVLGAEMEILSVHHADVGAMVVRSWSLPEAIVQGVTYHHDSQDAPTEAAVRVADLVSLGDTVATHIGVGDGDPQELESDAALVSRLGISEDSFSALCQAVAEMLDQILARYA